MGDGESLVAPGETNFSMHPSETSPRNHKNSRGAFAGPEGLNEPVKSVLLHSL